MRPIALTALLLTLACDEVDRSPAALPQELASTPSIALVGDLRAGQTTTLDLGGLSAGATVYVAVGTMPGAGPCPPALGGECLDIANASLLGTATANAAGLATLALQVPRTVPAGTTVYLQAAVTQPAVYLTPPLSVTVLAPVVTCSSVAPPPWLDEDAEAECILLGQINDVRAQGYDCGRSGSFGPTPSISMDESLRTAARVHSRWMMNNGTLTHSSPGGPLGDSFGERARNAGYNWRSLAENIERGRRSPGRALAHWLSSPNHCENLLSSDYEDIGIGRSDSDSTAPYWTLVLGRR